MARRNSKGQFVKGGGRSSGRSRSRGGSRGGSRSRKGHKVVYVSRWAGGLTSADGLVGGTGAPSFVPDPSGGSASSPLQVFMPGQDHSVKDAVTNLTQNIPFIGKDPNHAGNRRAVGGGIVLYFGGKWAKSIIRSPHIKVGRRTVHLWG